MLISLSSPTTLQLRRFSTIQQQPLTIVSRRAWLQYEKLHPRPFINKTAAPKEEEKPWPRNIVLTAYAVASVLIPYSFAWYLSLDQRARKAVVSIFPSLEDVLRSHFGHDEFISIQDLKEGVKPMKKLDDEDPHLVRKQQVLIEQLTEGETPVQIYQYIGGDLLSSQATLKGDVLALKHNLVSNGHDGLVAVDFHDLPLNQPNILDDKAVDLRQSSESWKNQIYSLWYYQPPTDPAERRKLQQVSLRDIEISRLEYTIKKLEEELKDLSSTRDIDEMRQELAQTRRELRSLRWKQRLGL